MTQDAAEVWREFMHSVNLQDTDPAYRLKLWAGLRDSLEGKAGSENLIALVDRWIANNALKMLEIDP